MVFVTLVVLISTMGMAVSLGVRRGYCHDHDAPKRGQPELNRNCPGFLPQRRCRVEPSHGVPKIDSVILRAGHDGEALLHA